MFLLCAVPSMFSKRHERATPKSIMSSSAHTKLSDITIEQHWPFMLTGMAAGFMSGLLGIGTGIVMMAYFSSKYCDMDQHIAVGTSLAATVPMGAVSAGMHLMKGNVHVRTAAIVCSSLLTAMFVASRFVADIDEETLRRMFAVLVAISSARMVFK